MRRVLEFSFTEAIQPDWPSISFAIWVRSSLNISFAGSSRYSSFSFINCLKSLINCKLKINKTSVNLLAKYSYIPSPNTIYQDIFKLEPLHYLKIDIDQLNKIIETTLIISIVLFTGLGVILNFHFINVWLLYFFYVWVAIYAVLSASQFSYSLFVKITKKHRREFATSQKSLLNSSKTVLWCRQWVKTDLHGHRSWWRRSCSFICATFPESFRSSRCLQLRVWQFRCSLHSWCGSFTTSPESSTKELAATSRAHSSHQEFQRLSTFL